MKDNKHLQWKIIGVNHFHEELQISSGDNMSKLVLNKACQQNGMDKPT